MKCEAAVRVLLLVGLGLIGAQSSLAAEQTHLNDLTNGDPFFYTQDQYVPADDGQAQLVGEGRPHATHSGTPHLPVYYGYMSTNYTYRFLNVMEQVFTMIGEGKHGLWRVEEAGYVREYLLPDEKPLPAGADLSAPENLKTIKASYKSFIPEIESAGYKYPDERVRDDGGLNFIDLPITHAVFDDQYTDAPPVDHAMFYCTMSGPNYPYARQAMNFAFAQPGANRVGPLGKRAGLNVHENFPNVLRLKQFPDANTWVNVGVKNADELHVKWKAVDPDKTKAEYYLVERPFFNTPYLFLIAVYDNVDNEDFSYLRPHGAYADATMAKSDEALNTQLTQRPRFHLKSGDTHRVIGLPIYGVHHPNRAAFGGGGACPLKGGDWGRYPETSGGAGWPTEYEEVTPLCDGVLIDAKFFANLDGRDWDDENKYLANAGVGTRQTTYTMRPGRYGEFTDPYNVQRGAKNPDARDIPKKITVTFPTVEAPVRYTAAPDLPADAPAMNPIGRSCRQPVKKPAEARSPVEPTGVSQASGS